MSARRAAVGCPVPRNTHWTYGPVRYVAWGSMSGRPRIATAGDDGTPRVWDPAEGREVTRLTGHTNPVRHLAWGELDGQPVLATASRGIRGGGTARVWDPEGGQELFKCYHDRGGGVWCVSWADVAGQLMLATAGSDGWACVWDISTGSLVGRQLRASEGGAVYAVAWGVMGGRQVLATAGADGTARVWDISTSTPVGPPLGGGRGLAPFSLWPGGSWMVGMC